MEKLYRRLESYIPYNRQEAADRALMLAFMERNPDCLLRSNTAAHFAATAWVVNRQRTKVLMVYHNIYNSWAWSGGHADGESDLMAVARKEIAEETGLQEITPLLDGIFAINVLTVERHIKKGQHISSHLHLDVEYLFEADDSLPLKVKEDENSAVGWLECACLEQTVSEPPMLPVYRRLLERANDC